MEISKKLNPRLTEKIIDSTKWPKVPEEQPSIKQDEEKSQHTIKKKIEPEEKKTETLSKVTIEQENPKFVENEGLLHFNQYAPEVSLNMGGCFEKIEDSVFVRLESGSCAYCKTDLIGSKKQVLIVFDCKHASCGNCYSKQQQQQNEKGSIFKCPRCSININSQNLPVDIGIDQNYTWAMERAAGANGIKYKKLAPKISITQKTMMGKIKITKEYVIENAIKIQKFVEAGITLPQIVDRVEISDYNTLRQLGLNFNHLTNAHFVDDATYLPLCGIKMSQLIEMFEQNYGSAKISDMIGELAFCGYTAEEFQSLGFDYSLFKTHGISKKVFLKILLNDESKSLKKSFDVLKIPSKEAIASDFSIKKGFLTKNGIKIDV